MSRRRRRHSPAATPSLESAAPVASSGYDAARHSTARGYVYWPTLDTRRELDEYSRLQLLKKARYLYTNVGFARRIINGLSNMVGYLTPQAQTGDAALNETLEAAFENVALNPSVFDARGRENFYDLQISLTRQRLRDGDCLIVLTEAPSGSARLMPYESHQIGNPSGTTDHTTGSREWIDGVKINKFGRHLAYRIIDPESTASRQTALTIDAVNAIYYADTERLGQVRAATALYHAVNNLLDTTEINAAVKLGIKTSQQFGLLVTDTEAAAPGSLREALTTTTTASGHRVSAESIFSAGGEIAHLNPGQTVSTIHDSRPHPNQMALLDYLARDIAWGVGVSADLLWSIDRLGGANTRYILADAHRWISAEQDRLATRFCQRVWAYVLAKEAKRGAITLPDGLPWWKVKWVRPERITVDRGRDGKLQIEQHRAGMLTLSSYYDELGLDWREEIKKLVEERSYIREVATAAGLDPSEIIPRDRPSDHAATPDPTPAP